MYTTGVSGLTDCGRGYSSSLSAESACVSNFTAGGASDTGLTYGGSGITNMCVSSSSLIDCGRGYSSSLIAESDCDSNFTAWGAASSTGLTYGESGLTTRCVSSRGLTDCESEFTAGSTSRTGLTIERTSHYSANNAGFTAGGDQNIFAGTDKICSEIYPIVMNSISIIKQWEENIFIFALLFIWYLYTACASDYNLHALCGQQCSTCTHLTPGHFTYQCKHSSHCHI